MSYLKDFKNCIINRDYPYILRLWEEYCGGDELDTEEVCAILKAMKGSEFATLFGREVEKILPLWSTLDKGEDSYQVLKLIVDLSTTISDALMQLAQECLQERYGHEKDFVDKLKIIGFRGKDQLQGAISNYELLSHFAKGNFVFHNGGWGVGEIIDVSLLREQVAFEFDFVAGKKELSFETAFKTLDPIPKTHFLALRFGSPDDLEAQANKDPLAVIHLLLKDLGPKTAAEIKDELCELVIPEEQWSKWWQGVRAKLKKDTLVSTPNSLREPFVLRKQGLSHEERIKTELDRSLEIPDLIQLLYGASKDFAEVFKSEEIKQIVVAKIKEALSHEETTPPHHLELLFLLQEVGGLAESNEISSFIQNSSSVETLVDLIEIQAFKKKTLMEVKKSRSDWQSLFFNLLLKLDANALKDYLFAELMKTESKTEVEKMLQELYAHPQKNPDTFLWYFSKLQQKGANGPFSDDAGKIRFFEGLLILLSSIEHRTGFKPFVKKIYNLIIEKRFALVRAIMKIASLEEVKEIVLLASKCHTLVEHDQKIFHSLAEVVYPELAKHAKVELSDEPAIIWTTQEGHDKLKNRIEQIATVEVVANAQEIEAARAHGDLRENAEFKAALEKRDRLQAEIKLLSDQLKIARVLTAVDVTCDEVGPGTIVECKNKQGKALSYTLLGPWDADPDKGILSFQSKLAQAMKGKKVGDQVMIPGDELTITSIRSIFA